METHSAWEVEAGGLLLVLGIQSERPFFETTTTTTTKLPYKSSGIYCDFDFVLFIVF